MDYLDERAGTNGTAWSRRKWLAASAGLAAACNGRVEEPIAADADSALQGGFIDAHVHVWTPDTAAYPISSKYEQEDMKPPSEA